MNRLYLSLAIVTTTLCASGLVLPDPTNPDTMEAVISSPESTEREMTLADIAARTADRKASMPVTTQRMARVKGEMVARIESDSKNNRIAVIVKDDGTIERRPVRVLATARVKPKEPASKDFPIDGTHAAAAAAGAAAGALAAAAAATAIAKAKGPKQNQPKGAP